MCVCVCVVVGGGGGGGYYPHHHPGFRPESPLGIAHGEIDCPN